MVVVIIPAVIVVMVVIIVPAVIVIMVVIVAGVIIAIAVAIVPVVIMAVVVIIVPAVIIVLAVIVVIVDLVCAETAVATAVSVQKPEERTPTAHGTGAIRAAGHARLLTLTFAVGPPSLQSLSTSVESTQHGTALRTTAPATGVLHATTPLGADLRTATVLGATL